MINLDFYQVIDEQIDNLNIIFKDNDFLKKQSSTGKKSFGFLLWFLQNYIPEIDLSELENFITEGNDDSSCDLIFNNTDQFGDQVFYVVQSKWFSKENISKTNDMTKEIKACITDFKIILSGKKTLSKVNLNFNKRYIDFVNHKKQNGKIKFLYVALCKGSLDISEYTDSLTNDLVSFDLMDLFKLKRNYIELEYKGIKTHNPIETPYIPKTSFNLNYSSSNLIKIVKPSPHEAYILLIKPQEIYKLFKKFGFSLFYKNIRNPLVKSYFNQKITDTVKNDPSYFWYFNNGITAISDKIYPFHDDADNLKVKGIQIINGAQTVYSIFEAYNLASDEEKEKMDEGALITLRLLKSGGQTFDLKVTRYTNSQNPINERDFHSNDEIQKRLQNEFLDNTGVWFETRRGEFRKRHKNISVISNESLGQTYLSYTLQDPFNAKQNKKLIFQSNKIYPNGLYETIFNDNTSYQEMYISFYIHGFIERKRADFKRQIDKIDNVNPLSKSSRELLTYNFVQYSTFDLLALFYHIFIIINSANPKGINGKLIIDFEKKKFEILKKYYEFIVSNVRDYISLEQQNDPKLVYSVWFKNKQNYSKLKRYLTKITMSKPDLLKEMVL